MIYTPQSSFGRPKGAVPVSPGSDAVPMPDPRTEQPVAADKWALLDRLTVARNAFALTHRDLNLLRVMLGFHAPRDLRRDGPAPIVYASNRALCERLNGMPCSTMRRHLARLIDAGIVSRQDSPNGKRYLRRDRSGAVLRAFGFDLSPLLALAPRIMAAAEAAEAEAAALALLREDVALMRRDLEARAGSMAEGAQDGVAEVLEDARRALRRRADGPGLRTVRAALLAWLQLGMAADEPRGETEGMSTNARENEQHHQRSITEPSDKKTAVDKIAEGSRLTQTRGRKGEMPRPRTNGDGPSLHRVAQTCGEAQAFYPGGLKTWHGVAQSAAELAPMLGIAPDVYGQAVRDMGARDAAISVLCLVERQDRIANPAGYFRRLIQKARTGDYAVTDFLALSERARRGEIVS